MGTSFKAGLNVFVQSYGQQDLESIPMKTTHHWHAQTSFSYSTLSQTKEIVAMFTTIVMVAIL